MLYLLILLKRYAHGMFAAGRALEPTQEKKNLLYEVYHSIHQRFPAGKSNTRMYTSFISQEKERTITKM